MKRSPTIQELVARFNAATDRARADLENAPEYCYRDLILRAAEELTT
jgi:hypothetical protein